MPRQRPPHRYPVEYYALFEQAQRGPFSLVCENESRARYIRADLYNLRSAVRDTLRVDPSQADLAEQYLLMENIVIECDNNTLHFRVRHYANVEHIRSALTTSPILSVFHPKEQK